MTRIQIRTPYLILIGEEGDPTYAKTGMGLIQWCPDKVAGQYRFEGCRLDLGVPDMTVEQAVDAGVGSLVVGVAPVGGDVPAQWWEVMLAAAAAGLDVVCGLHVKLADQPELVQAAERSGARLVDVRTPPPNLPVGNGRKRSGKRLLTVAADCAIGKKYTALALTRALSEAGIDATFRASGQTGIMIAGAGIPIDTVVADFISGAAECLSPDNRPDHWDVIEGQGSVFHPGYAGVSLGLLHGSQPDAIVVCHDATRKNVSGWEHYALPSVADCIALHLELGRRTNPEIRCVGVSVNTSGLEPGDRSAYLERLQAEIGLPCIDPLAGGCDPIVNQLLTIS